MRQERIDKVLAAMAGENIHELLVTDPSSIRYLTDIGVEPGERFLALYLHENGEKTLFVNRLFTVPEDQLRVVWLRDTDDPAEAVLKTVDADQTLAVDKLIPARFLIPIQQGLRAGTVLGSQFVDWVRAVKDAEEQELMRAASRINDAVMAAAEGFLYEGVTEEEVAERIEKEYLARGCEGVSFEPIVSFGPNAADPHHMPDGTQLREGDCIVLDIGGKKDGYCSDMTRTFFFKKADPAYTAIHDLVRRANEYAESVVRPGARLCEIDAAAREMISAAGYGDYFTHRLGHFIGREVHEYGDVSAAFQEPVRPGMCFSIEPGVYLPGRFGVRVEDLVLVTEEGCEVLNRADKHWKVIG